MSAEICAIYRALKYITNSMNGDIFMCSDSLGALETFTKRHFDGRLDSVIYEIVGMIKGYTERGWNMLLVWILAHSEIAGNEEADRITKIVSLSQFGIKAGVLRSDVRGWVNIDHKATVRRE